MLLMAIHEIEKKTKDNSTPQSAWILKNNNNVYKICDDFTLLPILELLIVHFEMSFTDDHTISRVVSTSVDSLKKS